MAGNASAADRTIAAAGNSVLILGIYAAETNNSVDTVTFSDLASSPSVLLTLRVPADDTEDMTTPFITSNGFIVDETEATTFITVIYRPDA
jgi:hypothetical protein